MAEGDREEQMIPSKQLFWGDNGVHEFWESEDHELLIFRNHGESYWSAHRNHGFLFGCRNEVEAAARLKVFLSRTYTWVEKQGRFRLQPSCGVHQEASDSKPSDSAIKSAM